MPTPKLPKWSPEQEKTLTDNASLGIEKLLTLLPFTEKSIKRRATLLGLTIKPVKMRKPDTTAKFEPSKHVIKHSSIEGKTAVWIPEEKLTVYVRDGVNIEEAVARIRNRQVNF